MNLIKNPKKGGSPPSDSMEIIILIFSLTGSFILVMLLIDKILLFFKIFKIELIIMK